VADVQVGSNLAVTQTGNEVGENIALAANQARLTRSLLSGTVNVLGRRVRKQPIHDLTGIEPAVIKCFGEGRWLQQCAPRGNVPAESYFRAH
jgi:hypothetical protein